MNFGKTKPPIQRHLYGPQTCTREGSDLDLTALNKTLNLAVGRIAAAVLVLGLKYFAYVPTAGIAFSEALEDCQR